MAINMQYNENINKMELEPPYRPGSIYDPNISYDIVIASRDNSGLGDYIFKNTQQPYMLLIQQDNDNNCPGGRVLGVLAFDKRRIIFPGDEIKTCINGYNQAVMQVRSTGYAPTLVSRSRGKYVYNIDNLTNCKSSIKTNSWMNKGMVCEIVADIGYTFNPNEEYYYEIQYEKSWLQYKFILDESGTRLRVNEYYDRTTNIRVAMTEEFSIVAIGSEQPKVEISGVLENCKCNYTDGEIYSNNKKLKIIANNNYYFNPNLSYYILVDNVQTQLVLSDNDTILTCTSDPSEKIEIKNNIVALHLPRKVLVQELEKFTCNYDNNEIYDTLKPIVLTIINKNDDKIRINTNSIYTINNIDYQYVKIDDYTVTTQDIEESFYNIEIKEPHSYKYVKVMYYKATFENCYCNYEDNEEFKPEKQIIITANPGYHFTDNFYYQSIETKYFINKETYIISDINEYFSIRPDNVISINSNFRATKIPKVISYFTNCYSVTIQQLNELAKIRQSFLDPGTISLNLSNFILNLYEYPFIIPQEFTNIEKNIFLATLNTEINSNLIDERFLEFNIGNITIDSKYNNVYDYINTTCTLYLPFLDKIILDIEDVIDKTISIQYVLDIYTNTTYCNVYHDEKLIVKSYGIIGNVIPFLQINSLVNNHNSNYNNINRAYVEIKRNKPYDSENIYGKSVIEYDKLSAYTDYVKVESVQLTTNATENEKNSIVKLLQEGVFI